MVSLVTTVSVNRLFSGLSPAERCLFQPTFPSCMWNRRYVMSYSSWSQHWLTKKTQITGDDTPALQAVLDADVWRKVLLKEQAVSCDSGGEVLYTPARTNPARRKSPKS